MTALSIRGLSKSFGSVTALDNVCLDIPDGQFVCMLGPSGCGKTTLLRLIAGLDQPDAGSIALDGEVLTETPAHRRGFGMVFQSLALFPHLSAAENIAYPLRIRGFTRAARETRARELLELVELPEVFDRRIHQLSGGQRQRVAIARALAVDPNLFLLDEPLSALDARLREQLQVELRLLQQKLGITTIVVTHDQREAMTMADLVVVMDQGRVRQVGPPTEIYRNPVDRFVAGFIGTSNLLPCRRTRSDRFTMLDEEITIPEGLFGSLDVGSAGVFAVRPEDVEVLTNATEPAPDTVDFTGCIAFVRDLGSSLELSVSVRGTVIHAVAPPKWRPDIQTGIEVGVRISLPNAVLLADK